MKVIDETRIEIHKIHIKLRNLPQQLFLHNCLIGFITMKLKSVFILFKTEIK